MGAVANKMALVVTRALPGPLTERVARSGPAWLNATDEPLTADEIVRAARDSEASVLLAMATDRIDAALIRRLPSSLRAIATLSVGHDHIDCEAARERGLAVLSTPDILSDAVAEMAMLLLLGAARRAHEGSRLLYGGEWRGWSPTQLLGRDVTGGRLGILGMGRIGRTIARRARGFDMAVHYHNRSRLAPEHEDAATYRPNLDAFLAESDFLVLAAPSTPATRGIMDASAIARLPRGAVVVNIARGSLVDDAALIAALRSGHVGAAGLDVFNGEPDIDPAYLELPNVFLQPHQGSSTLGTRVRMGELLLASIEDHLNGRPVSNRLV